jgi:hypothetical protein
MLDRIFVAQSERAEVPEAIRGLIFAQAGVSISGVKADDVPRHGGAVEAGRRLSRAFMSRFVRGGMLLLVASTGFAAGYFSSNSNNQRVADDPAITAPAPTRTSIESAAPVTGSEPASTVGKSAPPVVESPAVTRPAQQSGVVDRRSETRSNVVNPVRTSSSSLDRGPSPTGSVSNPGTGTAPAQTTTPTVEPASTPVNPPAAMVNMNVNKPKAEKNPTTPEPKEEGPKMP